MSTTSTPSTPIAPEVRLFLAKVRAALADLDPDELAEITDGLEADLGELVAERGAASLGDPVEYAGELRLAAGLPSRPRSLTLRPRVRERWAAWLDRAHRLGQGAIDSLPEDMRPMVQGSRPAWWLLRGAVLGAAIAYVAMGGRTGSAVYPGVILSALVGAALSLEAGRRWLRVGRQPAGRVGMLLLNLGALAALVAVPFVVAHSAERQFWSGYDQAYAEQSYPGEVYGEGEPGIYSGGREVTQIFPYDAAGKPLVGVQLFDQTGVPLAVSGHSVCPEPGESAPESDSYDAGYGDGPCEGLNGEERYVQRRVFYPWTNGAAQLYNVYPLPSRYQDMSPLSATAFTEATRPTVGALPFATMLPISLPGIVTSKQAEAPAKPK